MLLYDRRITYLRLSIIWSVLFIFITCALSNKNSIRKSHTEESACQIVEASTYLSFKGRKIPFSFFHSHESMYHWVIELQKKNVRINRYTTIINFDFHSDAYGEKIKDNTPEDFKSLRNLDIGNWLRFLSVNKICQGLKVLVSSPESLSAIKKAREPHQGDDDVSKYDDDGLYDENLFADPSDLMNSGINGPAIITIDYDFFASVEENVSKRRIKIKARKVAKAIFLGKIVPEAINFTYSDLFDKKSGSQPFTRLSSRDYVSKALSDAFERCGAMFKQNSSSTLINAKVRLII